MFLRPAMSRFGGIAGVTSWRSIQNSRRKVGEQPVPYLDTRFARGKSGSVDPIAPSSFSDNLVCHAERCRSYACAAPALKFEEFNSILLRMPRLNISGTLNRQNLFACFIRNHHLLGDLVIQPTHFTADRSSVAIHLCLKSCCRLFAASRHFYPFKQQPVLPVSACSWSRHLNTMRNSAGSTIRLQHGTYATFLFFRNPMNVCLQMYRVKVRKHRPERRWDHYTQTAHVGIAV